jgi:hypothetical protein
MLKWLPTAYQQEKKMQDFFQYHCKKIDPDGRQDVHAASLQ